ncbi:tRNA 2'-phosphotransferase 1 isoform X5 [Gorilla gorilla gorilla]|uniref:tRNA 2'-phosphotransferase 1 isoform X5 n=1 Tax=Gorilla gorilla gorilla TaxID=9595 RepID=UPI003009F5B0
MVPAGAARRGRPHRPSPAARGAAAARAPWRGPGRGGRGPGGGAAPPRPPPEPWVQAAQRSAAEVAGGAGRAGGRWRRAAAAGTAGAAGGQARAGGQAAHVTQTRAPHRPVGRGRGGGVGGRGRRRGPPPPHTPSRLPPRQGKGDAPPRRPGSPVAAATTRRSGRCPLARPGPGASGLKEGAGHELCESLYCARFGERTVQGRKQGGNALQAPSRWLRAPGRPPAVAPVPRLLC